MAESQSSPLRLIGPGVHDFYVAFDKQAANEHYGAHSLVLKCERTHHNLLIYPRGLPQPKADPDDDTLKSS